MQHFTLVGSSVDFASYDTDQLAQRCLRDTVRASKQRRAPAAPQAPQAAWDIQQLISAQASVAEESDKDESELGSRLVMSPYACSLGVVHVYQYLQRWASSNDCGALVPMSLQFVLPCAWVNAERGQGGLGKKAAAGCVSRGAMRKLVQSVAHISYRDDAKPIADGAFVVHADYYSGAGVRVDDGTDGSQLLRAIQWANHVSYQNVGAHVHAFMGHAAAPKMCVCEVLTRAEVYTWFGFIDHEGLCAAPEVAYHTDAHAAQYDSAGGKPRALGGPVRFDDMPADTWPRTRPPVADVVGSLELKSCFAHLSFSRAVDSDRWGLVAARCCYKHPDAPSVQIETPSVENKDDD